MIEWSTDLNSVQNVWDEFESNVIKTVDKIVPLTTFDNGKITPETPKVIKNKINKRNRLLKSRKRNASTNLKQKINQLNYEIKTFYFSQRRNFVRKGIVPGNSRSLWLAVNVSKGNDQNS